VLLAAVAFAGFEGNPEFEKPIPDGVGDIQDIKLPAGFKITYFHNRVPNARQIALSKANNSILYVGTRTAGAVYAVVDWNLDGIAESVTTIATGLRMPNGVAWHQGTLYIAENHRITKIDNIDTRFQTRPQLTVVKAGLPVTNNDWHGWKYIKFSPVDNKLYVPFGAPCNYCLKRNGPGDPPTELSEPYATVSRLSSDFSTVEIVARGVRNSVGFDWHPTTKDLWFTENGRDYWGPNIPWDEVNRVSFDGEHFGFPFCYGYGNSSQSGGNDPIYRNETCNPASQKTYTGAKLETGPHVASVGLKFYTGTMFPAQYRNAMFEVEHGSWNRPTGQATGYRVATITLDPSGKEVSRYTMFATGWLNADQQTKWGRPVDVEQYFDGSILISDDQKGAIYRVTYA